MLSWSDASDTFWRSAIGKEGSVSRQSGQRASGQSISVANRLKTGVKQVTATMVPPQQEGLQL